MVTHDDSPLGQKSGNRQETGAKKWLLNTRRDTYKDITRTVNRINQGTNSSFGLSQPPTTVIRRPKEWTAVCLRSHCFPRHPRGRSLYLEGDEDLRDEDGQMTTVPSRWAGTWRGPNRPLSKLHKTPITPGCGGMSFRGIVYLLSV